MEGRMTVPTLEQWFEATRTSASATAWANVMWLR